MMQAGSRRKWFAGLIVLLTGVGLFICLPRQNRPVGVPILNAPILDGSTITVVPGIHLIGGLGPAAAYVIETTDGLVLIDTGLDDDGHRLKSEVLRLGLDFKRLRAIFLTHVHGDHCAGAERLRAETGARVYAGQADVAILSAGSPRDAFFSTYKMPGHHPHATTVDIPLQGNESIPIGDVRIQILATPGHTPGSTCYLVEKAGLRILFSGDVIYRLGEKPLGTYTAYLAPRFRGDAQAYLETLRHLRSMSVPDLLLPGHPNASVPAASPQLTEAEWVSILDAGINEMQRLINHYTEDGTNFLDGTPRQLMPDLYYLGDFQGSCVYGFIAESKLFLVNAPGGPGLADFVATRLRDLGVENRIPFAVILTSCDSDETAGLPDLIERHETQVVASSKGVESLQNQLPRGTTIISADQLQKEGWFNVMPIEMGGRGIASIDYLLKWKGKTVLLSSQIPVMIDQQSRSELQQMFPEIKLRSADYLTSLRRLLDEHPNLWLPRISENGQNANLYEDSWQSILERNYQIVSELANSP